jgi:hypothetical protein
LKPGKEISMKLTLADQWKGVTKGAEAFPRPGQFRFVFKISVEGVPGSKVRWWQGSLASNPVELALAAANGEERK